MSHSDPIHFIDLLTFLKHTEKGISQSTSFSAEFLQEMSRIAQDITSEVEQQQRFSNHFSNLTVEKQMFVLKSLLANLSASNQTERIQHLLVNVPFVILGATILGVPSFINQIDKYDLYSAKRLAKTMSQLYNAYPDDHEQLYVQIIRDLLQRANSSTSRLAMLITTYGYLRESTLFPVWSDQNPRDRFSELVLHANTDQINGKAISVANDLIAYKTQENEIHIWAALENVITDTISGSNGIITHIELAHDGKTIGIITFKNVCIIRHLATRMVIFQGHAYGCRRVGNSDFVIYKENEMTFVQIEGTKAKVIQHFETRGSVIDVRSHPVYSIVLIKLRSHLTAGAYADSHEVWDVSTGQHLFTPSFAYHMLAFLDSFEDACFVDDMFIYRGQDRVFVVNMNTGESITELPLKAYSQKRQWRFLRTNSQSVVSSSASTIAVSQDGQLLAISDKNAGEIRVVALETRQIVARRTRWDAMIPTSLLFGENNSFLYIVLSRGAAIVSWDHRQDVIVHTWHVPRFYNSSLNMSYGSHLSVHKLKDDVRLAVTDGTEIHILNRTATSPEEQTGSWKFVGDRNAFLIFHTEDTLRRRNIQNPSEIVDVSLSECLKVDKSQKIEHLVLDRDGQHAAVWVNNQEIRVADLATNQFVGRFFRKRDAFLSMLRRKKSNDVSIFFGGNMMVGAVIEDASPLADVELITWSLKTGERCIEWSGSEYYQTSDLVLIVDNVIVRSFNLHDASTNEITLGHSPRELLASSKMGGVALIDSVDQIILIKPDFSHQIILGNANKNFTGVAFLGDSYLLIIEAEGQDHRYRVLDLDDHRERANCIFQDHPIGLKGRPVSAAYTLLSEDDLWVLQTTSRHATKIKSLTAGETIHSFGEDAMMMFPDTSTRPSKFTIPKFTKSSVPAQCIVTNSYLLIRYEQPAHVDLFDLDSGKRMSTYTPLPYSRIHRMVEYKGHIALALDNAAVEVLWIKNNILDYI